MEIKLKPILNKELEKLTVVILSKDRNEELSQIINYWSKTPSTIVIIHDTNSPRPYSLGFRAQGTKGIWMNDGNQIYLEGVSKKHRPE